MAKCEVCGNEYEKPFLIANKSQVFDSFECAIHALAQAARTVDVRSSGTGCKRKRRSIAVLTAPSQPDTGRRETPLEAYSSGLAGPP